MDAGLLGSVILGETNSADLQVQEQDNNPCLDLAFTSGYYLVE